MEPIILYVVISEEPFTAGACRSIALNNEQVTLPSKERSAMFKPFTVIIAPVDVRDRYAEFFAMCSGREVPFCSSSFRCDLELREVLEDFQLWEKSQIVSAENGRLLPLVLRAALGWNPALCWTWSI